MGAALKCIINKHLKHDWLEDQLVIKKPSAEIFRSGLLGKVPILAAQDRRTIVIFSGPFLYQIHSIVTPHTDDPVVLSSGSSHVTVGIAHENPLMRRGVHPTIK